MAGEAADAPMSETSNAMAARYATNLAFKAILLGDEPQTRRERAADRPAFPQLLRTAARFVNAAWVVKRRADLLIVRTTDAKASCRALLATGGRVESGHTWFRSDRGNVAARPSGRRRADRDRRMRRSGRSRCWDRRHESRR